MLDTAERDEAVAAIERHVATLRVGQRAAKDEVVSAEQAAAYAARHETPYPGQYVWRDGDLLVPLGMVFLRPAMTFGLRDGPPLARGGIFTETHRRYHGPVKVGRRTRYQGEITRLYESRGFCYLSVAWQATDETGALLAEGEEWHTLGFVRKGDAPGGAYPDADELETLRRGPGVAGQRPPGVYGEELYGEAKVGRLRAGSRGVHDDDTARRAGLRGGFVVNEFHFAQLTRMLISYVGESWFEHGEIEAKYVAPLLDGDTLIPRGTISGEEPAGMGRLALEMEIWCENQHGQRLTIGHAGPHP
jgi:hypothetical protein